MNPEKNLFIERYRAACQKYGVEPLNEVAEVNDEMDELIVTGRGCGEVGVMAIADAVRGRSSFAKVCIRDSFMGCEGAVAILESIIACASPPTTIDFTGGNIRSAGASSIANYVRMTNITTLILEWNALGVDVDNFSTLMRAAADSETLQYMDLRHNHITSDCCGSISTLITKTKSLRTLDLRWNQIRSHGASQIACAVPLNNTLIALPLSGNDVEYGDLNIIEAQLKANTSKVTTPVRESSALRGRSRSIEKLQSPRYNIGEPTLYTMPVVGFHAEATVEAAQKHQQRDVKLLSSPRDVSQSKNHYKQQVSENPNNSIDQNQAIVRDSYRAKLETLTERNIQLATELAQTAKREGDLKDLVGTYKSKSVQYDVDMEEKNSAIHLLEGRVSQLEKVATQSEELIKSRDAAMEVIRHKAAAYQRQLSDLMQLSNGRSIDAVVEDIRSDYEKEKEALSQQHRDDTVRTVEGVRQELLGENASLSYRNNEIINNIASKDKTIDSLKASIQQLEKIVAEKDENEVYFNERSNALVESSETERRRLLKKIDDMEEMMSKLAQRNTAAEEIRNTSLIELEAENAKVRSEMEMLTNNATFEHETKDRQLERSRMQVESLQNELTSLRSEMKLLHDDQKSYQTRLESRVQEQVNVLLNTYSTPIQALSIANSHDPKTGNSSFS